MVRLLLLLLLALPTSWLDHAALVHRPAVPAGIVTLPAPIYFKPGSTEYYSVDDIAYMYRMFAAYRSLAATDSLELDFTRFHFRLAFYLSGPERRRNPRLGHQRAAKIITYATRSFGLREENFSVKDLGSDYYHSPPDSAVTGVFLRFGRN